MAERGAIEYKALVEATRDVTPPCSDDPRFILDSHEISPDELSHIALTICRLCPLKAPCRAYGDAERPKAGIWGGKKYTSYKPREAV